jgi:hypothetical protein
LVGDPLRVRGDIPRVRVGLMVVVIEVESK